MRYDTDGYARSRLLDTIVLHKGEPVLVDVVLDGSALFSRLGVGGTGTCPLSELDLSPIQLGYFNSEDSAHYLQRVPKRRDWRQGLRGNNVNMPRWLNRGVVELCKGTYPSFEEACDLVECGVESVAFSLKFAVSEGGRVVYKGSKFVGDIQQLLPGREAELRPQYEYLAEALKEAIGEH